MKKILVVFLILTNFLIASDCKHFWYSAEQSKYQYADEKSYGIGVLRVNYAILENGNTVVYTEMSNTKTYMSNFEDMVYLGCGNYLKTENVYNIEKGL